MRNRTIVSHPILHWHYHCIHESWWMMPRNFNQTYQMYFPLEMCLNLWIFDLQKTFRKIKNCWKVTKIHFILHKKGNWALQAWSVGLSLINIVYCTSLLEWLPMVPPPNISNRCLFHYRSHQSHTLCLKLARPFSNVWLQF